MRKVFFLLTIFFAHSASAQEPSFRYEKDFISSDFYKGRREEVRKQLPDSSFAILFSAPVRNRSNDTDFPYHQHSSFYYLTGFTEPNSLLLIFNKPIPIEVEGKKTNEILFIAERDKDREQWNGRMANRDDAKSISGIQNVMYTFSFDTLDLHLSDFQKILFLPLPAGVVDDRKDTSDLFDLVTSFKKKISYPSDKGDSYLLSKIILRLREVKQKEEIVLMKKAVDISCKAHMEMMKSLTPGMSEYQVQAVGEYVFKNDGAEYPGYPSICGGGENSSILHYISNRKTLEDGDLILLDMGAEYHGYTADVTRTLPVSGKYSPEQKIIYDLVLKAHDSALVQCKPGSDFYSPHQAASEIIKKGLFNLGIITDEESFTFYFMHGTSHYLGLDVHDVGTRNKLREGNVITVEPGIYIPKGSPCDPKWWNIGIRIEDDILITKDGYENLSVKCPVKTEEIESLMKQPSHIIIPENIQKN